MINSSQDTKTLEGSMYDELVLVFGRASGTGKNKNKTIEFAAKISVVEYANMRLNIISARTYKMKFKIYNYSKYY